MTAITITNGTIVNARGQFQADLVIDAGIIQEIRASGRPALGQTVDATGLLILPGAIDIHFHCRAPAYPERGDFATETRAAAAGGVTTVFEMPISKPAASTANVINARRAHAERDAYVDFGLYAAPASLDECRIRDMVAAGAIGFKTFMTAAPPGRDDEFDGLCATDNRDLLRLLELIRPYALPAVFHAEDNALLEEFEGRIRAAGRTDPDAHPLSRPPVVEATAISTLTLLAQAVGRPVHIAHVSSGLSAEVVRDARRRGAPVTAETCLHYLLFTSDVLQTAGPFAKINPPIRSAADRAAIWAAVADGTLEVVATDHAPFGRAEKEAGWANILTAPPGAPSVEMLYPVMLDQALRGRLSLGQVVELVSARPAQLYNLYPYKGIIQVGAQADFVLYDPKSPYEVNRDHWFSKAAESDRLYTGMTLQGRVRQTWLRGEPVFADGEIVGRPGQGRFVRPLLTESPEGSARHG
jgi:allantoinase